MTVTLELRPDELAALNERANADGVDVETVLRGLVAQIAPLPRSASLTQETRRETPELTEKQKAAIALIQSWREEDRTDDPEELAARDRDMEEFKANMNRWRAEEGRPLAYLDAKRP